MIEFVLLENDEDIADMRGKGLPRALVVALGRISVKKITFISKGGIARY